MEMVFMPYAEWSSTRFVEDYRPLWVDDARWGDAQGKHPGVEKVLRANMGRISDSLRRVRESRGLLHAIPQNPVNGQEPFWRCGWFSALDAASLVAFVATYKPKTYIEIGSGFSTRFCRYAINAAKISTRLISIDPEPRAEIDALCDETHRRGLETCDPALFAGLGAGDVLFLDGSHRALPNSDVNVFFLDILPRLPPGVLVHIHDIFLPYDYVPQWRSRFYNEQYMLAAILLHRPTFDVVLPNQFVCRDELLALEVKESFKGRDGAPDIPFLYERFSFPGTSFWLQTK
jgi:predicted O-methyltransferase YrrM